MKAHFERLQEHGVCVAVEFLDLPPSACLEEYFRSVLMGPFPPEGYALAPFTRLFVVSILCRLTVADVIRFLAGKFASKIVLFVTVLCWEWLEEVASIALSTSSSHTVLSFCCDSRMLVK